MTGGDSGSGALPYDARLTILHADMDAFYAAVEVLDDPTLRGRPLIVGHPGRRGVVSTASYEARRFGVHSALPSVIAQRLCPGAVWRTPRMTRYAELSRAIRGIFLDYTPIVEPLSLDEAFLDVHASLRLFGGAVAIAEEIRRRVPEETGGLTVSVGVAENMFLAKLASDLDKPNGLTVLAPGRALEVLHRLPVERLWGVGRKCAASLHELGLRRIGDLVPFGRAALEDRLGTALGTHLWELAHGRDSRRVETGREAKSISSETTFGEDLRAREEWERALFAAAENVAATLRAGALAGRTVSLKVRTGSYRTMTRARTLEAPTDLAEEIYRSALELLEERVDLGGEGIRLLGVGVEQLVNALHPRQGDLFREEFDERGRRTERLLDAVRAAHGNDAVRRARLLARPGEVARTDPGDGDPARIRRRDLAAEDDERRREE